MTKKYLLGAFLSLLIGSLSAQNVGVDYFNTNELEGAKLIFEKQLAQNPGESNYYLGEIAYAKDDFGKAKSHYEQGLIDNPDYVLNNVGLGKLLLKTDVKAAEAEFSKALRKDRRNVEVIIAIAKAYSQNGMNDKANSRVNDAKKASKNSPLIYVFEGDRLKDADKLGEAAGFYAQAIDVAKDYVIPYIKTAQVYERINPDVAIEKLNAVLEINPNYKLAYKYMADIYYKGGKYARAIDSYKAFFQDSEYSIDDLTRYAASLYFTKDYDEAKKMISEGQAKDPNNFVLNRLLMYSAVESEDFANGLTIAEKFFSLDKGTSEYISRDYVAYGKLLIENKQIDKALEQYDLAIKLDPKQFDLYKEIAGTLADSDRTLEAANYFKKYIELAGEKVEATDYFNMGRYYYLSGVSAMADITDSEVLVKAKSNLADADAAFAIVEERVPASHLGPMWRARANSQLDAIAANETKARPTLAKPHYEKTIEILSTREGNNNSILIEAYRYMSSCFYLLYDETKNSDDKAKTIIYSEKLLDLDPENAQAKQILEALR